VHISRLFAVAMGVVAWIYAQPASAQRGRATLPGPSDYYQPGGTPVAPTLELWTGGYVSNSFIGGYFGGVTALNPERSLWADGFVLRVDLSGGRYSSTLFDTGAPTDAKINTHSGSMFFGYRAKVGEGLLTGYLGPSWESHLNPDPTASIRGTEVGIKTLVDYSAAYNNRVELYVGGTYATAFQTYTATARVGFQIADTNVWLGPQIGYFQNEAPYREGQVGGYIRTKLYGVDVSVSGGYRNPFTDSPTGYFASLYLGVPFR
jgi:hypothetical protein